MRPKLVLALLLMVPLSAAFAGCTSCDPVPIVSARGIVSGDSAGGDDGFALDVLLREGPAGVPIVGGGVVVYWGDIATTSWQHPRVEVVGGPGGGSVVADPGASSESVEPAKVLRLLSDGQGRVRAHVPPNHIVAVVAAKAGFTEEWTPALATGDAGQSGAFEMPLYRDGVALDVDGVWAGPGAGSPGTVTGGNYAWDPRALPFAEGDEAARAYAARIVDIVVTVNWSNEPTGFGDLGVAIGELEGRPAYFEDDGANTAAGPQSESATLNEAQLHELAVRQAPAVIAGPATNSGFAAPFGLPYTMHVVARFEGGAENRGGGCGGGISASGGGGGGGGLEIPGAGVAMMAAGALVALALTRRLRAS